MQILEVKKEDDLYFQGAFWIIADSFKDILLNNNIQIIGNQIISDYDGNYKSDIASYRSLTHRRLWVEKFKDELKTDREYDYYPRGRVGIDKGLAYINIPAELIKAPHIIDIIRDFYGIEKLDYEVIPQSDKDMDNYRFLLK